MVACTLHICAHHKRKRLPASPRIRAGGRNYAHAPIYPFPKGICIYTQAYTYMHICVYICIRMRAYICIQMYVYRFAIYVYIYSHAQTLAREPHTHTHTHALTRATPDVCISGTHLRIHLVYSYARVSTSYPRVVDACQGHGHISNRGTRNRPSMCRCMRGGRYVS
jgi:hypothetical protein